MSGKHRANLVVEGLESKVALSGFAPTVAMYPQPLSTQTIQLDGSVKGTYVTQPGNTLTPTYPSMQLHGSGVVSPIGVVSLDGTITGEGGQLTLRGVQKNVTETIVLQETSEVLASTDTIMTFSYKTSDGLYAGSFVMDCHTTSGTATTPSQFGTFDAKFC